MVAVVDEDDLVDGVVDAVKQPHQQPRVEERRDPEHWDGDGRWGTLGSFENRDATLAAWKIKSN